MSASVAVSRFQEGGGATGRRGAAKGRRSRAHDARAGRRLATGARTRLALAFLALAPLAPAPRAEAASPALGEVLPRGGQRGTTVELRLVGERLADAAEVLFYDPSFRVESLEAKGEGEAIAHVAVAADCRLGEHALRLRTRSGITELRTFWVGPFPSVPEKEPNGEIAAAQEIDRNVTVEGVIENEDVDWFALGAKRGERISVEVEGMRLGTRIFDPHVAILSEDRFELASSDDTPLLRQDPYCQVAAPRDGRYLVRLRESSYGGGGCRYRLHIGSFPRPAALFPPGGRPGEELAARWIGDVSGPREAKVTLPAPAGAASGLWFEDEGGPAPSAVPVRVVELPATLEVEPDGEVATATVAPVPGALEGVLSEPGDVDTFRFHAEKGRPLELRLFGRRLRSPIDSVLDVLEAGGKRLAGSDDSAGPDSELRFTPPADGEYIVRVGDQLGSGGPTFVYRLEIAPVAPALTLGIPRVEPFSQARQALAVPRGGRIATLVSAARADFAGDVVLELSDLPAGVEVEAEPIPKGLAVAPVLLLAAPDAPLGGSLARLEGRPVEESRAVRGRFRQVAPLLVGEPGQSVYWQVEVDRLAVAVTEEAPFSLSLRAPSAPLVRGGVLDLEVTAERKPGFEGAIALESVFAPPGISAARGVAVAAGQKTAKIHLDASGSAPLSSWRMVVTGSADSGRGTVRASSGFAPLEVVAPWVTATLQRASVEQGKTAQIVAALEHHTPFEGEGRARLLGLPHEVKSEELEVTGETTELAFAITTSVKSPPGNHKGIFCQLTLPAAEGASVRYRSGATELRIDRPLPPPKGAPAPKPAPKAPPAAPRLPAEKRLSRLEKLRLEHARRLAADGATPKAKAASPSEKAKAASPSEKVKGKP